MGEKNVKYILRGVKLQVRDSQPVDIQEIKQEINRSNNENIAVRKFRKGEFFKRS